MKIDDLSESLTERLDNILNDEMREYIRYIINNNLKFLVHNNPKNVEIFLQLRAVGGVDYKTDKMHLPVEIEGFIDHYLERTFGHPYRTQSLYTTQIGSSSYGNGYAVIPFGGGISYCYSRDIKDLLFNYMDHLKDIETLVYSSVGEYPDIREIYHKIEPILLSPHNSFSDKEKLLSNIVSDESKETIISIINKSVNSKLIELAESYKVTNDVGIAMSSIPVDYEIMVDAPRFLLINKKYITRKFGKSTEDYLKRFI